LERREEEFGTGNFEPVTCNSEILEFSRIVPDACNVLDAR
jgi:hypothetical protein